MKTKWINYISNALRATDYMLMLNGTETIPSKVAICCSLPVRTNPGVALYVIIQHAFSQTQEPSLVFILFILTIIFIIRIWNIDVTFLNDHSGFWGKNKICHSFCHRPKQSTATQKSAFFHRPNLVRFNLQSKEEKKSQAALQLKLKITDF